MARGFFRELKHYTVYSICKEIGENIDETKRLVGILKKYGVVKVVKKSKPEFEELSNQDIVLADASIDTTDVVYIFDYVGVILLEGHVFKCYPKYIFSSQEPTKELKKVIKVIKKYNSNEQLIYLLNGQDDNKIFNQLAVSVYLLEDYFMYGIYTNQHEIIETNGEGEILWDRTINETFALLQNNKPYYLELQTKSIVENDKDYFKRLHECILTKCTSELNETGILELFDFSGVTITDTLLEEFGDSDYILYRLQCEIQSQFVTHKQNLLKTIYAYIANDKLNKENVSFSLYGTNSFNLVWEKVCAENFGSVLNEKIWKLPLGVSSEYGDRQNQRLVDIIDKSIWYRNHPMICDERVDTLRPDLVCIYPCNDNKDYCFGIFDAKYYCIDFKKIKSGWEVSGQPGVGDVTKQYLYQLAYNDFVEKQGYKYVQNMFFCPQEEQDIQYGHVEMKMMHDLTAKGLQRISVVKLCADEMYDLYLSNQKIDNLFKYIPGIQTTNYVNENFSNRMKGYLVKVIERSQLTETKIDKLFIQNKFVYPDSIIREVGAKLIYDIICPFAKEVFYIFSPGEVEEEKIAEDEGDSAKICMEIATAAIEIEKHIKNLSDQQLREEVIIKSILKRIIDNKEEIHLIILGEKLENLTIKIMELIRNLYL